MEAATSLLLLLVLFIILAGFVPIRHPFLVRKMVRLILDAGADSCSVGSVRVVAWKSITLQRVSVFKRVDSEREYGFSFTEAELAANLMKLAWNRKKIKNTLFPTETDLFKSIYVRPATPMQKVILLKSQLSEIKGGAVSDLRFSIKGKGREIVSGFNGTLQFGSSEDNPEDSDVKIAFPVMKISGDGFENVKCAVSFSSEGEVFVQNGTARYYDGRIKSHGTINLLKNRIESYLFTIEKMDLAYWYAVHVGIGKISGSANLHIEGDNVPFEGFSHDAELRLAVSPCVITDLPVQQSLATSLFIPSLSTIEFSKLTARAVIGTGDTVTASFFGNGDQLDFNSNGWVRKDGLMQQQIEGIFSAAAVDKLPPLVRKTLEPAPDGGRRFRCRLFGTFDDPRFELDEATLRKAIGTMFDEFGKELLQQYLPK